MDELGSLLLALAIIPFILFFLRIILLTWRYYILTRQLKQQLDQEQARRQVEININNDNGGGGGATLNNSNPINTENDISILPKGYDLPPAYDEVVINSKQQLQLNEQSAVNNGATISGAVSTVTIETMLDSSNDNLAAAAHNTNNNINDEHTV